MLAVRRDAARRRLRRVRRRESRRTPPIGSRGAQGCYAGSYGLYTGADGGIAVYVFDGSRYVVSATARPSDIWDGSWHHVDGTFDGSMLRLYVDGRPVGAPTSAPLRIDYAGTSSGAYLGRFAGGCDLAFRGDVDLVRLWSGAFSAGQVAQQAADELGSGSGAPGMPLPGAAPGTTLPGPSGSSAPSRSCVLRLSRTRVATARPTVVRVRVGSQGSPVRAARVTGPAQGRGEDSRGGTHQHPRTGASRARREACRASAYQRRDTVAALQGRVRRCAAAG